MQCIIKGVESSQVSKLSVSVKGKSGKGNNAAVQDAVHIPTAEGGFSIVVFMMPPGTPGNSTVSISVDKSATQAAEFSYQYE